MSPCQRDEYTEAGDSRSGFGLRAFGVRLQGTFGSVDRRRIERFTSGLEANYRAGLVMAITFLVRVSHLFWIHERHLSRLESLAASNEYGPGGLSSDPSIPPTRNLRPDHSTQEGSCFDRKQHRRRQGTFFRQRTAPFPKQRKRIPFRSGNADYDCRWPGLFDPSTVRGLSIAIGGSRSAAKWIDEGVSQHARRLKPEAYFPTIAFRYAATFLLCSSRFLAKR